MKQSSKTALGGIISALSIILMFLTAVIPLMSYALPLLAGTLLVVMVKELGGRWAFGVYAAVSLLSIFVIPDKEAATFYVAFFGWYPILKPYLEGHFNTAVRYLIKFVIFNLSCLAGVGLTIYVFGIPFDETGELGKYGALITLLLANLTFFVYDILLNRLMFIYVRRWKKKLHRVFK